jgi:hypothetical protein
MDIVVMYLGSMAVANQSVTLNNGLVLPEAPISELNKISAIPGRIMKGLSGLVSDLLGMEETKIVRRAVRKYISPVEEDGEEVEGLSIWIREVLCMEVSRQWH